MKKFGITIASLPDRENLVGEIFYDDIQWAEISQEKEEIVIQFYPHPREEFWEFPLDKALEVLEAAKKKFIDMQKYR